MPQIHKSEFVSDTTWMLYFCQVKKKYVINTLLISTLTIIIKNARLLRQLTANAEYNIIKNFGAYTE